MKAHTWLNSVIVFIETHTIVEHPNFENHYLHFRMDSVANNKYSAPKKNFIGLCSNMQIYWNST